MSQFRVISSIAEFPILVRDGMKSQLNLFIIFWAGQIFVSIKIKLFSSIIPFTLFNCKAKDRNNELGLQFFST